MRRRLIPTAPAPDAQVRVGGAGRGVRLSGAADLIPDLRRISREWIDDDRAASEETFLTIIKSDDRYALHGGGRDGSRRLDRVNALCDLIAAVARERAETDFEHLYLHSAGVEIGGRLILFPATRRAGKSLLSTALAKAGHTVFSDDVVPVSVAGDGRILGHAMGAAQRLRQPLPETVAPALAAWCDDQTVLSNKQYAYLSPDLIAPRGQSAPIGGVVFLDRQDDPGTPAELSSADAATEMGALLHQNFARTVHSGDVLTLLGTLADTVPVLRLTYAAPDGAAVALAERFATHSGPLAMCHDLAGRALRPAVFGHVGPPPGDRVVRDPDAEVRSVGGALHVSDAKGRALHQFDALTEAVWELLRAPTTATDVADAMAAAFPDVDPDRIATDADALLQRLADAGLLKPA